MLIWNADFFNSLDQLAQKRFPLILLMGCPGGRRFERQALGRVAQATQAHHVSEDLVRRQSRRLVSFVEPRHMGVERVTSFGELLNDGRSAASLRLA